MAPAGVFPVGATFERCLEVQEAAPILNIVVPQVPRLPRVAARPFFMVTLRASWISRLSLHLMQYPVIRIPSCHGRLSITPGWAIS